MLKIGELVEEINTSFAILQAKVGLDAGFGLFDEHKHAEEFFRGLCDIIYQADGYSFENINITEKDANFPAIDLGERGGALAVQVTSRNDREKFKDTIKSFIGNGLCGKYKKLIFLIIGEKKDTKAGFDTEGKFEFNEREDIIDLNDLVMKINGLSLDKIQDARNYVRKQIGTLSTDLFEIEPIRLNESDIKDLVLKANGIFKEELANIGENISIVEPSLSLPDNYIEKKNKLNEISDEYFKGVIRKNIRFFDDFKKFLQNPINKKITENYLSTRDEMQEIYLRNRDKFNSIEKFFDFVYHRVEDKFSAELGYDKRKIWVILHCMYFNCDLGIKP